MNRIILIAALAALAALLSPTAAPAGTAAGDDDSVQEAKLSPEAEKAIERALAYLAGHQNDNGSWGEKYHAANTSLSLMAFMLKGHFPKRGAYGEKLDKAVRYLVSRTKERGGYVGENMYEHGLATLALSEVWGMSDREEIQTALKRAVRIILRSQSSRGGWRYLPQPYDQDISVTVMQIVALASAKEAGIHVPAAVIDKAKTYVKQLQVKYVGGFGYTSPGNPRFGSSAAGVMSLLMTGERDTKEVLMGLEYLRRLPGSKFDKTEWYFYGHYYAVQAMYQAGDSYYQQWYPPIHKALLSKQRPDGSWTGGTGGTAYSSAMAVLILGVPYRFLPIYQR